MKLYKVTVWQGPEEPYKFVTRFVSTQEEVKELIRKKKHYGVWEVTIKERLTKQDLISLLEGDAPGNQPQVMTPVDLIIDTKLIREKKEPTDAIKKGHD